MPARPPFPSEARRPKTRTRVVLIACGILVASFIGLFCWGLYDFAKRDEAKWAYADLAELQMSFWNYYDGRSEYPAQSIDQLREMNVLHSANMRFLAKHLISFKPFNSSDADSMEVLTVKIWHEEIQMRKGDLVKMPSFLKGNSSEQDPP